MKRNTRLVPYVLIGTLMLGAGLGVGLGLSEGPMTANYTKPTDSQLVQCVTSLIHNGASVSCSGRPSAGSTDKFAEGVTVAVWFRTVSSIPKGFAPCMEVALQSEPAAGVLKELRPGTQAKLLSPAALKRVYRSSQSRAPFRDFSSALKECGVSESG